MNDIVQGGSVGCTGTNPFTGQPLPAVLGAKVVPNAGWNATVGWDPVTGMGTPNIGKLLALANSNTTR
jgi:tripeptidyl-peptidase-1